MVVNNTEYWQECIAESFEDAGLTATQEQINTVASWVEGAHDNFSMAFGYDAIPNPLASENDRLERELQKEKDKVVCPECKGSGEEVTHGPYHSSFSNCYKCNGEGKISL